MSVVHQAIVLAAGEGRRLRPITETTPKPLVPFFGRPLLDWAIDALVTAGVTRVAVNAFHLGDLVAAHVATLSRHPALAGVELFVSREPALLGTGGAVRYLRGWLDPHAPFFVLNSDAVMAAPPTVLTRAPSLLVTRDPYLADERRLQSGPDGRLTALVEGRGTPDGYAFCGLTLADPDLPERLPDGPSCILRQGFIPFLGTLEAGVQLVETNDFFADTGSPTSLVDAHVRGLAYVSRRAQPLPR